MRSLTLLIAMLLSPAAATNANAQYILHTFDRQKLTGVYFSEGANAGDINGDGRMDIIHRGGWFEQPKSNAETSRWTHHKQSFSNSYGGAEMYAYDVDGDGDNDVITSHVAHDYGLGWYEQIKKGGKIA